jgi:hypothetical protein
VALIKPLTIVDGQIQQIQAGDTLDAVIASQEAVSMTNGNVGAIVIGTPVYVSGNDEVDKAQADASGTKNVFGLVLDASIASAGTGSILTNGFLTATTGQWDAVTGDTGGLVANSLYFLDPDTAGKLTKTSPTTIGDYVCPVGVALSTTVLKIDIDTDILL